MLDGGLQRWKFREYPVYHGPPPNITPQEYIAKFDDRLVRTFEQMVENFNSKREQVTAYHLYCIAGNFHQEKISTISPSALVG